MTLDRFQWKSTVNQDIVIGLNIVFGLCLVANTSELYIRLER